VKLLFLSNEFPNACEPTKATFNYDLLDALSHEHTVEVVAPIAWLDELRKRAANPRQPWRRTLQVERLTVHHPRFYYTPGVLRHWYGTFLWWSLRGTLRRIRRGAIPDCVLSYWAHPDGEAAVRLARLLGIPSIVMVGGSDVLLLTRDPRRRRCIQAALDRASAVVAVSRDLVAKIVALGVPADRVHQLRRGVKGEVFSPGDRAAARRALNLPDDRPILLWVGRMVPVKDLGTLLATCDLLRSQLPDFQLCLVGDGPLRSVVAEEISQRGLADHVKIVGTVPHNQLGDWFRAADLTLLSSRSEGVPNVLLESLACGTPFVSTNVGGVSEIGSSASARLVPPNSPGEFAQAIAAALSEKLHVPECDRPQTLPQFAQQVASLAERLKNPTQKGDSRG
jgi:glycosyltransferase involved in cell wall biosynthesis